jgi:hypothetical protein
MERWPQQSLQPHILHPGQACLYAILARAPHITRSAWDRMAHLCELRHVRKALVGRLLQVVSLVLLVMVWELLNSWDVTTETP